MSISSWVRILVALCLLASGSLFAAGDSAAETFDDPGFVSDVVATLPPFTVVGLAWAPDGRLFVWQKNGVVRIIKQGVLLPTPFIDLSAKVNTVDDRGFWGLAFHPDFPNNGWVYMTYTFEPFGNPNDVNPRTTRLTRVTANPANPDVALANSEIVILGSLGTPPCSQYPAGADCIPFDSGSHGLGNLQFAPDGTLFVGNGDGASADFADSAALGAQDITSYRGKILRIRDDGTAPPDNPFYDGTNSIQSKVWLYGIRNPFRFFLHPTTNEPWFGDVGWNTWEELNHGMKGKNYGWPCYEGVNPQPQYQSAFLQCRQLAASSVVPPVYTYDHTVGTALIGGPIYTGETYPEQYRGSFFFVDYGGNFIRRLKFDASGNPAGVVSFATNVAAPVTIEQGPDGDLYYLSFTTGQIRHIRFNGPSAVADATPSSGYSPLAVAFSSAGSSDAGGGSITFAWDFGDGGTSTVANPSHTYVASGVATFSPKLTVRNSAGLTSTATLKVTVGSKPPVPTILTPANNTLVQPGQTVNYQGSATDPDDGTLPASALTWTILLHHNSHVHTFIGATGAQGSFVVQDHGPIGTFGYEIILTATDSSGLQTSTSVLLPVGTVADTTPPSTVTGLSAGAVSSSQINLSWAPATDNVGVTGYRVESCAGAGCSNFAQIGAPTGTTFGNTGLAAGTSYSYRVRAVDAAGNLGGYSTVASASTPAPDITPPSTVTGLGATAVGSGQINLSWTAATDNVGVTGYQVERCTGAGCSNFASIGTSTGTNSSDTGLAASTSYSYRVRAADAAGNVGGYSNVASATTGAAQVTGLVAAYGFNEGSGPTVGDVSGNGNTGTINGATWTPQGRYGAALSFNGTSSLVVIPASTSLNVSTAMTLSAWIQPTASQGGWRTIMQREVNSYFLNASNDAGPLRPSGGGTFSAGGINWVVGPTPSPVSTWTHIALTYDGAMLRLYVNGVQAATLAQTGTIETPSTPLRIGGNAPYGEYFQGLIDEVRVYNRALSAAEIQADMNTPIQPPAPDTTPPSAPGALSATAVSSVQVNLSWTAATDNVGVTTYQVERCGGSGCSNFGQVATTAVTSFNDSGLMAGTTYSYRVWATDAASNQGPYSNVATATTLAPDTTPPTAPSGLGATAASSTQINLSWTAATDNVGVTGYRVESCAGAGCSNFAQIGTPTGTTFSNTGLTPGTSYSYRVRAVDAAGNLGDYSNVATATTLTAPDTTPPTAPTGLTATAVSTSQINLSWTASTDNVGVTGYRLERCQGANCTNFAQIATPTGTTFSDTGRAASTAYRYRVRAADAAGNLSGYSNIAAATTQAPDTTAPSTPSGLAASAVSSTQINLTWTASTDNVGVTGYQVQRCQGTGCTSWAQVATPTTNSFSDTGRTASTVYRYRVRATDAAGNLSGFSSIATATTPAPPDTTPPSTVTGLSAGAVGSTQINLSWTAATDNVGVTGYRVESCAGAGCSNFAQIGTPTATTFSNTGLTAGTSYSYRVRAVDAAGNLGGYSTVASATTPAPDITPPSTVTGLGATAVGSGQINLSWTAATDNVGVTGYQVERCAGAGCSNFAQVLTPTGTSVSDTGLAATTSYSYRVRAVDAAGNVGGYSNVASATTGAAQVTGLVAAYAFNEGSGPTVADASGNGNTGTISGATWAPQGRYGAALSFNGTSSLVVIPASTSLNVSTAMTLSAWIQPTASQGGWRTIMQREVNAYFLNASNDAGPLRPSGGGTFSAGGINWVVGPTPSPVSAWTHIALTYDGAMLRLYVNGVQAATLTQTGTIETPSTPLRIGGNAPYGEYFQGLIDEVRVYNRALSAAEIQSDMATAITP